MTILLAPHALNNYTFRFRLLDKNFCAINTFILFIGGGGSSSTKKTVMGHLFSNDEYSRCCGLQSLLLKSLLYRWGVLNVEDDVLTPQSHASI